MGQHLAYILIYVYLLAVPSWAVYTVVRALTQNVEHCFLFIRKQCLEHV